MELKKENKKKPHLAKWAKVLIWTAVIWTLLTAIIQFAISDKNLARLVNGFTEEVVDGKVGFSRISLSMFSHFPNARLSLEDVSITYPSEKFALVRDNGFQGELTRQGRGADTDTLATFKKLSISLNYPSLLLKKIRVPHATLTAPRIFVHRYNDSTSNINIFKFTASEDDTVDREQSSGIPDIVVGNTSLEDHPHIVYTDSRDTVAAVLRLNSARLSGKVGTKKTKAHNFGLDIDDLRIAGRSSTDSLGFVLPEFHIEKKNRKLNMDIMAYTALATASSGRMSIPIKIKGEADISDDENTYFEIKDFNAEVAGFPLQVRGTVRMMPDKSFMDIQAKCTSFDMGDFISTYGKNIDKIATGLKTDAQLHIDMNIKGEYFHDGRQLPPIDFHAMIPESRISHEELGKELVLSMDMEASSDSTGSLAADINHIYAGCPGLDMKFSAHSGNILAEDPLMKIKFDISAVADSLSWLIPENSSIGLAGDMDASINGKIRKSQMSLYRFTESSVKGKITSDSLRFNSDTLDAHISVDSLEINIGAAEKADSSIAGQTKLMKITAGVKKADIGYGKNLSVQASDADLTLQNSTAFLTMDDTVNVHPIEGMFKAGRLNVTDADSTSIIAIKTSNRFIIRPVEGSRTLPYIRMSSWTESLAYLDEVNRARIVGMGLDASAAMDTTGKKNMKEFVWADYMDRWKLKGSMSIRHAVALTPYFPIKNSIDALKGNFNNDSVNLERFVFSCGNSELDVSGKLDNLRNAMHKEGPLALDLSVNSESMDMNELLKAWAAGSHFQKSSISDTRDMSDRQFEKELIEKQQDADTSISAVVIPENVVANIALDAKDIKWKDLRINRLSSSMKMLDGCIQMKDFEANSNMGDILMDGFYSSKDPKKPRAGFDLALKNITANDVIGLIPAIDTIMPSLKSFEGLLNCELAVTTDIDEKMNIKIPSTTGVVCIKGDDLYIKDSPEFKKLAKTLLMKNKKEAYVESLDVKGLLADGSLRIFPFKLDIDRYRLAMTGTQNMDMSFLYHISVLKSPVPFRLGVDISGDDFSDMKIHLGKARYKSEKLPSFNFFISYLKNNLISSIKNVHEKGVNEVFSSNESMVGRNLKKTDDMVESVETAKVSATIQKNNTAIIKNKTDE